MNRTELQLTSFSRVDYTPGLFDEGARLRLEGTIGAGNAFGGVRAGEVVTLMLAPDLGIDLTVNEIVQQGDEMNAQLPVVKLSCSFVSAMAQGTYVQWQQKLVREEIAELRSRRAKPSDFLQAAAELGFAPMAGTIEQDLALSNAQLTQLINGIADASGLTAAEDARDVLDDDAPPSPRDGAPSGEKSPSRFRRSPSPTPRSGASWRRSVSATRRSSCSSASRRAVARDGHRSAAAHDRARRLRCRR